MFPGVYWSKHSSVSKLNSIQSVVYSYRKSGVHTLYVLSLGRICEYSDKLAMRSDYNISQKLLWSAMSTLRAETVACGGRQAWCDNLQLHAGETSVVREPSIACGGRQVWCDNLQLHARADKCGAITFNCVRGQTMRIIKIMRNDNARLLSHRQGIHHMCEPVRFQIGYATNL